MPDMPATTVFTIGELSRRTGLPVKTIRFYSDEGLLPPTQRTNAGYRLYDAHALVRLELVRTLRELGIGLPDVSRALARETTMRDLATSHVDALDEQIRRLRLRRAVLRAVLKRDSELEEVELMNRIARMPDEERRRLVDEFWDEMVDGLDVDTEFYTRMRSAKPDLPDDPAPEQLEAWIEFAELVQDPDFRQLIRDMSTRHARTVAAGEYEQPTKAQQEHWFAWIAEARTALDAGAAPDSPAGRALADRIATASARPGQDPDDPAFRTKLLETISEGADPRSERYWQLLATINGWPPIPSTQEELRFLAAALRASGVNPA
ncbi:MerR family transcriptional regulator [Amycolatopsis echigonensis]|uniref:DNA-binding transcriptional MerR regulator n=2 Tax=Amycolatopsis echigonensis TaxID=2576905 RepID=A0A2N3WI44_9PSEU|nr:MULTISPECIES: MerR family transcriptional regulator [Amycolatopsis]MBB2506170.1 MerR family transcriptional regulator [Amycolatopsis echigonensis]PKV93542.1 DNA-binding transcriptional MerR regulator [Amycolatopsis niigatensis]